MFDILAKRRIPTATRVLVAMASEIYVANYVFWESRQICLAVHLIRVLSQQRISLFILSAYTKYIERYCTLCFVELGNKKPQCFSCQKKTITG